MSVGILRAAGLALLCVSAAAARAQTEPDGAASAAYEDRLIDGGNLPPDISAGNTVGNASGWSRALRAETTTSRISRGDVDHDESGLRLGSMLDTPNFGAITLDANLRASSGRAYESDTGSTFTLYQMAMPMNGGWWANNSLGVTSVPAVDLARQQQRFWVPAVLSSGLATEWHSAGNLQVHASAGQPGLLAGVHVPTFEELGGRQLSAGVQWNGADAWSAAVQAVNVEDVRFGLGPLNAARTVSGHSWLGSFAWNAPDARVQLSVVGSAADERSERLGTWVDTAIRSDRVRHTFGTFRFDPDMLWGNQPLTSDHQGGYYRAAFQNRRWIVDGGVDYVERVSGDAEPTIFGTGYVRYQSSSRLGVGGGLNARRNDSDGRSMFAFVDRTNRLGVGRLQADHATDDLQERTQLTLNQTWNTPAGTRLGNTLILGRDAFAGDSTSLLGVAVNGGSDLRGNLSADLSARWDNATGRNQSSNVLANIALNWTFAPGWSLGASYYISRNTGRVPLEVTSPIEDLRVLQDRRTDDEGYFITVRRQWQAGSRPAPLAGPPGAGAGSIVGVLFLDDNDNGLMDAGETGAPNVVMLLNGRFAARTSSDGRFEFASVAAGAHVLTVVSDNLPLPWAVRDDGTTRTTVGVRQRTFVAIAAQKQR